MVMERRGWLGRSFDCYNSVCGRSHNGIGRLRKGSRAARATRQEGRGRRAVAGWLEQEGPGEHARVSSFCFTESRAKERVSHGREQEKRTAPESKSKELKGT